MAMRAAIWLDFPEPNNFVPDEIRWNIAIMGIVADRLP
jgi:hypothetical protein